MSHCNHIISLPTTDRWEYREYKWALPCRSHHGHANAGQSVCPNEEVTELLGCGHLQRPEWFSYLLLKSCKEKANINNTRAPVTELQRHRGWKVLIRQKDTELWLKRTLWDRQPAGKPSPHQSPALCSAARHLISPFSVFYFSTGEHNNTSFVVVFKRFNELVA